MCHTKGIVAPIRLRSREHIEVSCVCVCARCVFDCHGGSGLSRCLAFEYFF